MRLIDGRPDDPGRAIARRAMLLLVPAVAVANAVGAVVVFVLAVWVLPVPDVDGRDEILIVNSFAAGAYVVVAVIIGTAWGLGRWRTTRDWLVEDRAPTDEERVATLRVPLRQLEVSLVLWGVAVAGVVALNAARTSRARRRSAGSSSAARSSRSRCCSSTSSARPPWPPTARRSRSSRG